MNRSTLTTEQLSLLEKQWAPGTASVEYRAGGDETSEWDPDGILTLHVGDVSFAFAVRATGHVNAAEAAWLAVQAEDGRDDQLVIAERITASAASVLRERGVGYLDAAGNAHIERAPLLVHVEGRKPVATLRPVRAFAGEGLKVVFILLLDPTLASASYRTLAELSGVSHGVAQYTIKGLEQAGFVARLGRTQRRLTNRGGLLDRWAAAYAEALRPKITEGQFAFTGERADTSVQDWQSILISEMDRWSGEPAADLATGYLRPEHLTLYTRQSRASLMKALRAVPSPDGSLTVLNMFWPEEAEARIPEAFNRASVPDVVIYADLLATGDPRNAEVASMLREWILSKNGNG